METQASPSITKAGFVKFTGELILVSLWTLESVESIMFHLPFCFLSVLMILWHFLQEAIGFDMHIHDFDVRK